MSRGPPTTARASRPASCISASARSSARIRRCTPRPRSMPAICAGASSAQACARPRCAMQLKPQDGLYTLAVRGAEGERLQVIGAIKDVLVAPEDPEALLRVLCDPAVKIVTLTVTEKGYCYDPATAALDEAHPDIVHDLAEPCAAAHRAGIAGRSAAAAARGEAFTRSPCCAATTFRTTAAPSRRSSRGSRRCGIRQLAGYIATRSRFPPRWSTASRPRRPTRTAPRFRGASASRMPRRS